MREWFVIALGPGIAVWIVMSLQVFTAMVFGIRPWGEPTAVAMIVTAYWWAMLGAVWLGLATENFIRGWFQR